MKSLKIKQNAVQEKVTPQIIDKMYKLTKEDSLTPAVAKESEFEGSIVSDVAYEDAVTYLRTKFPKLTIQVIDNNYYIRFKDPEVLKVLIANGVGDSVGITTAQTKNTNVGTMFKSNTSITSFDEFPAFQQTLQNDAFFSCTNLQSIDLSQATHINDRAFRDCTSLVIDINCPNLMQIGKEAFRNSGVKNVLNLGNIQRMEDTFYGCNIDTAIIPESVTEYLGPFRNGSVTKLTINEENLISLRYGLPLDAIGKDVMNLKNVTASVGGALFNGGCTQVYLPKATSTSWTTWFFTLDRNNPFHAQLVYFRDLSAIADGESMFRSCAIQGVVINNTTVIPVQNRPSFDVRNVNALYVPNEVVDSYKADEAWGAFGDKIKPISELPIVDTKADWDKLDQQGKNKTLIREYM